MTTLKEFRCEVCGLVTTNPIHWFVIRCGDSDLTVYRWNSETANAAGARHYCGEAHAEIYISRWFDSVCAPPQRTFTQNLASCNSTCRDEKRLRTERMLTQSKTSGRKIPPKAKNHEDGLTARIATRHSPGFGGSIVAMFDWRKGLVAGHRLSLTVLPGRKR